MPTRAIPHSIVGMRKRLVLLAFIIMLVNKQCKGNANERNSKTKFAFMLCYTYSAIHIM